MASNGITLSSSVRANLLSLQGTASLQATVQNRLATGKKVNSALDNATSYFTAASFTSRAGQLSSLLDSIGNAVQTLKAADTGISSITKLVDNLRATARQALQATSAYTAKASLTAATAVTGATTADLRGPKQAASVTGSAAASTLTAAGNLVLNGTSIALASGDTAANVVTKVNAATSTTGVTASLDGGGRLVLTQGDTTTSLVVGGASTGSTLTSLGLTAGTTAPATALDGRSLTFTVGSGPTAKTATFAFSDTNKSLDDLNTTLSTIGLSASLDSSGKLAVTTTGQSESQSFTVTGSATATGFATSATASSTPQRGGAGADQRDAFVSQYNGLLTQIDTIAKDSSFNGVNLLTGDTLSVIFNETSSSKLDIRGVSLTSSGLNLGNLTGADFNDSTTINAVLGKLDAATSQLQTQASKFGSNNTVVQVRQDYSKQLVNILQVGSDNLVLADSNEEGANLLSLNTRQQLSQTALSLASQADQAVLRLFG